MELVLGVLAAAVLLVLGNVVGGYLLARWHVAQLRRRSKGKMVLTYDDGPGERLEPRLLEVLSRHGARATFFVNGQRVLSRPHRCAALADAGHEIACHGHDHVHAWKATPWRVWRDIHEGFLRIEAWARPDTPFRPPYGKLTVLSWVALVLRGTPLAKWTHDTRDTMAEASRPDVDDFVARVRRDGGGVVLLHSFDRQTDQAREDYVVEVTEALLAAAGADGWEVCCFSGLAGRERATDSAQR